MNTDAQIIIFDSDNSEEAIVSICQHNVEFTYVRCDVYD